MMVGCLLTAPPKTLAIHSKSESPWNIIQRYFDNLLLKTPVNFRDYALLSQKNYVTIYPLLNQILWTKMQSPQFVRF